MNFSPKPKNHAPQRKSNPLTTMPTQVVAGRGGALPVVQVNIRCSETMALMFSEISERYGSSRKALAHLLKEAGYNVPSVDLNTKVEVRRHLRRS